MSYILPEMIKNTLMNFEMISFIPISLSGMIVKRKSNC